MQKCSPSKKKRHDSRCQFKNAEKNLLTQKEIPTHANVLKFLMFLTPLWFGFHQMPPKKCKSLPFNGPQIKCSKLKSTRFFLSTILFFLFFSLSFLLPCLTSFESIKISILTIKTRFVQALFHL